MSNQKKITAVASLKQDITSYDTIAFVGYEKVTHQQLEELRLALSKENGKIRMAKNSLVKIALKEAGVSADTLELEGPTALVFANQNNLSPIKIVSEKGKELETFPFKSGLWENQVVESDYILRIANLPSREELIARLVGQMKSPHYRLVYSLKSNLQKLTVALDQIRQQKS